LLRGAVYALLELEKISEAPPRRVAINLSRLVEHTVAGTIDEKLLAYIGASNRPWYKEGRTLFYSIVLAALLTGAAFHLPPILNWFLDWLRSAVAQPPVPPPPLP